MVAGGIDEPRLTAKGTDEEARRVADQRIAPQRAVTSPRRDQRVTVPSRLLCASATPLHALASPVGLHWSSKGEGV